MKKRFNEEKIIDILKEAEAGLKPAELCRKHSPRKPFPKTGRQRFTA